MSIQTPKDKFFPEPIIIDDDFGIETGAEDLLAELEKDLDTKLGKTALESALNFDYDLDEDSDETSGSEEE